MKLRIDFVTNSSSTSFGVAAIESLVTAVTAGGLVVLINAVEELAGGEVPAVDPREGTMDPGDLELIQQMEHYQQEWEQVRQTLDPDDPLYADVERQYTEYIGYLGNQLEWREYDRYLEEVRQYEEEMARQAQERWIRERQRDLEQALEQQSLVRATREGYGEHGFDVTQHDRQLEQLAERVQELRQGLQEHDADIDYMPREREPIGPSEELLELRREHEARMQRQREAEEAWETYRQARREELQQQIAESEQEAANQLWWSSFHNVMTRGGEIVQAGADLGVDVLATLTGPAGVKVRTIYVGVKEVGGGLGEGIADLDNIGDHVGRGIVRGGSNVVKDRLGDKEVYGRLGRYGRYAQSAYTVGSETVRGMYTAYTEDESIAWGAASGAFQGTLEAAGGAIKSSILPEFEPDVDFSEVALSRVTYEVPTELLVRTLEHTIDDTAFSAAYDTLVRGEDLVFDGFNRGFMWDLAERTVSGQ